MAKRKGTAEELEARAESKGYKRGLTERKTALETTGSTTVRLRRIKRSVGLLCPVRDQRLPAGANLDTDTLYTRWTLTAMRKDLQRDLPSPDEALRQASLSSRGNGGSRSSNGKDFFVITSL